MYIIHNFIIETLGWLGFVSEVFNLKLSKICFCVLIKHWNFKCAIFKHLYQWIFNNQWKNYHYKMLNEVWKLCVLTFWKVPPFSTPHTHVATLHVRSAILFHPSPELLKHVVSMKNSPSIPLAKIIAKKMTISTSFKINFLHIT